MDIFHITWVTHNSRVSERMKRYGGKKSFAIILNLKEREEVCRYLNDKIREKSYNIAAINVLGNHVHLILACTIGEKNDIVRQLKGYSSFHFHKAHMGLKPHVSGKRKSSKLWAPKYGCTTIVTIDHLYSAIEYVEKNHLHHHLPALDQRIQFSAIKQLEEIEGLQLL